jgi:transcription initiation factor TFIIB
MSESTFPGQTSIVCLLCKSKNAITDPESAEIVCSKCGMVMSDKIDETRNLLELKNRKRGGMPTSLTRHGGLYTLIGRTDKDARGHKIKPYVHSTMGRLRTWNFRIQTNTCTDRNLIFAFNELSVVKPKLGLSEALVEKSAYIYRKAQERGLIRGRTISAVLTAAIYISCREVGVPKTLKEIARANNIAGKIVPKTYRMLLSELDLKIPNPDPMKCIVRIANKVGIKENTKRIDIMDKVIKKEISAGKAPMGMAATVLYISCINTGENKTQKDIAEAAGISGVTIRKRFKDLTNRSQLI